MFFKPDYTPQTQEEKIDYMYDELKKDESHRRWSRIWSWFWRIFIIASTYWLYLHPESILDMLKVSGGNTNLGSIGVGGPMQELPTDLVQK